MHLYLSGHSHLNSAYTNEDGQVLYQVVTPFSMGIPKTSTITCVVPTDRSREGGDTSISMQDTFTYFGEVEHNVITSSHLRWDGNQFETKTYFKREGWGAYGRNRVFTGPDGREYKWLLLSNSPKLINNDDTQNVVAKFHRRGYGIIGKAHPASLEIFASGEHMIKEILITFIYVEKIRKDKERAAHAG